MPTPNSEINSDMKFSVAPLNVDPNSDDLTDIILLNSDDANMDTFSEIPLEFDSSSSSIGTLNSADDSNQVEVTIPMLTDIAEETIYETEFFEETLKLDDNILTESKNMIVEESSDISNILMETITGESNENSVEDDIFTRSTNIGSPLTVEEEEDDDGFLNPEVLTTNNENINFEFDTVTKDKMKLSVQDCSNGVSITAPASTSNSSACEVSNLITVSNNTNLVSNILENCAPGAARKTNNISEYLQSPKKTVYTNLSNVIQINSLNSNNISTLQPITVQSGPKLVPISIAPSKAAALKRPATLSVGPASSNVLTKVIVSQGKAGQPIRILPNTVATSSPVKTITAAQAKQMGIPINLQPIIPSTTKPLKQKLILSNIPPGAQVLRKIQPLSKSSTPTKILPAPLVSKTIGGQTQKIILHPDYLVKAGATIPGVSARQMILANLKSAPLVTNHSGSPKKQVQYIKLINNVGSTNLPTITTAKGKFTPVTQNSTIAKINKETPIIVASSNFATTDLNVKTTNNAQTSSAASTSGITVVPMLSSPTVKTTSGQRLILPAVTKPAEIVNQSSVVSETKQTKSSNSIMYLPDDVLKKIKGDVLSTPVKLKEDTRPTSETAKVSHDSQEATPEPRAAKSPPRYSSTSFEAPGGLKSRKPCNCTRSQCLKLYCECFANGEFCNNCNCTSCHNNISHEENRQNAIRSCLDRNPQAFRPKIGKCLVGLSDRRHTKGCHCKRSGCLKNYCECYEAQIPCSDNCKCVGCKNIDDGLFTTSCSSNNNNFDKSDQPFEFQTFSKNKLTAEINDAVGRSGPANPRHAFSFIKDQVVEATCQCLLAQAEDVNRRQIGVEDGKKYILEEFGRCLIQIIECAPDKYLPS